MQTQFFDVAIVGCGPTGAVLANLLGGLGCRVVVLEREREVHPIPRATHIDEETLRNFQATGLMDELLPHTALFGDVEVVDHAGARLFIERIGDPASPHGYTGARFFDQPRFERVLRHGLQRWPHVTLELGVDVIAVDDHGDRVHLAARRSDGTPLVLHAAWVVGCDGGRSLVRAAMDTAMTSLAPRRHWLIVDTLLRDPADAALLPGRFRYLLARERLTIYAHGIGLHRRWEFQLDHDEPAPDDATVRRWLAPHIDPDRLHINRIAKYAHNALVAANWRRGRLLLAGDAAHMMPPSAGQGMCAGIRDAINLAWKLHRVVTGHAAPDLLDTYEHERRPHVLHVLRGTLFIGARLQADTPFQRWRRRLVLRLVGRLAPLRALMRHLGLRRPPLRHGCLDPDSRWRGHPLPQVRVRHDARDILLDDLLGYRFALLLRPGPLTAELREWAAAHDLLLLRPGHEFADESGHLLRFMRERNLEFALVRPDRQIFAAGPLRDLQRAQAVFAAQLGSLRVHADLRDPLALARHRL